MALVCDDCGNHSPDGASACGLCGATLREERGASEARERRKGLLGLVAVCVLGTPAILGIPGAALYVAVGGDRVGAPVFLLGYGLLCAALLGIGERYRPREDYDGVRRWDSLDGGTGEGRMKV